MGTQTDVKVGYSIMEAAKLSGLPESTLRYYESIGIIAPIARDASSKHRVYSEDDLNVVISVACLSATGMSIEDMRTYLSNRTKGPEAADEQIALLERQQEQLIDEAQSIALRQRYVATKVRYWQAVEAGDVTEAKAIADKASLLAAELRQPAKH